MRPKETQAFHRRAETIVAVCDKVPFLLGMGYVIMHMDLHEPFRGHMQCRLKPRI